MCEEDQPRERAERLGCGALSVADLWALVLRTGSIGNPVTKLTRDMMAASNNRLTYLERRTRAELMQIKGLGKTKAIQVEAVMELIRRYNSEEPAELPSVMSSKDLYAVIKPRIAHLPHEEIRAIALCHNHPSGTMRPSRQDDEITRRCLNACKLLEISMLDHIIVSPHAYYSYNDEGRLTL